jgi:hypothetical protein
MAKGGPKTGRQRPLTRDQTQRLLEKAIDNLARMMTTPDIPPRARERAHHVIGKLIEVLNRLPKG